MREIFFHSRFKKDVKRMKKRGLPLAEMQSIIDLLAADKPLAAKHRDHVSGHISR